MLGLMRRGRRVAHDPVATILVALTVLAGATGAHAEEDLELAMPGGRARAMGGAYTAIADDLSAQFWNPAGLAGEAGRALQAEVRLNFGNGAVNSPVTEFDSGVGIVPVVDYSVNRASELTYNFLAAAARLPGNVAERAEKFHWMVSNLKNSRGT